MRVKIIRLEHDKILICNTENFQVTEVKIDNPQGCQSVGEQTHEEPCSKSCPTFLRPWHTELRYMSPKWCMFIHKIRHTAALSKAPTLQQL